MNNKHYPDSSRIMPRDAYKSHEEGAPNKGKARPSRPNESKKYDRSYTKRKPKNAWQKGAAPGRVAALKVLRIVREREAFAHDLISKHIDSSSMSREDRAFATRLVLGVVSARGTLDEIINRNLNAPTDVEDDVRDALQISVYEIMFLEKDPYAAVDQGVELVKEVTPKASGLANAVLRKVVATKDEFPYGNPAADLGAFARAHAFPEWLAKRLIADLGVEVARDLMRASNEPAPLFVAVNPLRATCEEVVELLEAAHGAPEPVVINGCELAGCYRLSEGRALVDGRVAHAISQGKLFVSDAMSQMVANLVLPDEKPASFLEIGAGRGTKTLLLQGGAQRRYGSQIETYVTLDNHEYKTQLLADRAEEYGVRVSEPLTGDALRLGEAVGERLFNVVFVDAPCSGLGTLRRHPEIRWRTSEEAIAGLAKTGEALIAQAAKQVAIGGRLAYATCTVTHAENNAVVTGFLASDFGKNFKLVPLMGKGCFTVPLQPGSYDAHFLVVMERVS